MRTLTLPQTRAKAAPFQERALRICFVIDELATAGTETQLLALIRHLDRDRFRPHLVLLRGERPASRALEPADCPVLRLGVGSLRSPRTLARAARFVGRLWRWRIDVVQAYFPDSSYFAIPLAWLAGVRHRLRTRNNVGHWLTPSHRRLGTLVNRLATGTVVNCEAARRALLQDEGPRPESVAVIENGVDLERFLSLQLPPRQPESAACVGTVANLRPVKGLDVLARAAGQLHSAHPNLRFRVAGEGDQRAELTRLADKCGVAESFAIAGALFDVPGFLAGLDIAVLPSRAEGMSNAVLEYMAAGRPIVATAVGATPDLIIDGEHGLLVPPEDAPALAAAIDRLLRDPELAGRLGAAARRRARARYGRAAMVRRFQEFYESLRLREGR
jgi:glycosyltransferase involved in cell wall biosynthesis